jgi:HK97 family phage portal protein
MSPLKAGLLTIDKGNSNSIAGSSSFKNKGLNGIIAVEGEGFEDVLGDEQQDSAEKRMDDRYNGVINWGKTMVTNQKVTYTKLGLSPVDLNLLRDAEANFDDICNLFGIKSGIFNNRNSDSTHNNAQEFKKSAYNDAVLPLVQSYVDGLNNWLTPSYGDNIRIISDTSDVSVLQADRKVMTEWLNILVTNGTITRNEARKMLGLIEAEGETMNTHTVGVGTMPIEGITFDPFVNE